MSTGTFSYPLPANEPVLSYAPGSSERKKLKEVLKELKSQVADIPQFIGSKEVKTGNKIAIRPPHEKKHILGYFHKGEEKHVSMAIEAALTAKKSWSTYSWENRAHIFLKAADLLATKYRPYINGTTMLGQSKNAFQAEIDAACEFIDFLKFNVHFLSEIYKQQPISGPGMHNRLEYRPLEGFVLAVTPFNFTSIGGNLPTVAALCGNVVIWKCAYTQVYSAQLIMRVLKEAGLPDGVINLVYVDGPAVGKVCFSHKDFAGVHFTGSTQVFNSMWSTIGNNISTYKSYPRIVGETGGKDFVLAHKSADPDVLVTALLRGAFEFQGQEGFFIQPTIIETKNPQSQTMCEEIFGPVLTIYVYPANNFEKAMDLVDSTSPYALTGSIIAQDRAAIELATKRLEHAAGNFYINDKPTGAIVGQQPFGGARASGTNDKAGSHLNLYRWLSARTVKETFNPPTDFAYPFMLEK
ncbi:MAG: aldehyde dehydrogenase family protein [Chitinophagaceae bacterium]|nr:aldehyde dehydrogenase family protein [Chitinophagaceae bacterium]